MIYGDVIHSPPVLFHENERFVAAVFAKRDIEEIERGGDELAVRMNERRFLSAYFQIPKERIFFLKQTHGTDCHRITKNHTENNLEPIFAEGDALFTEEPDILLAVRTADCLPLFIKMDYRSEPTDEIAVGIIHAGWRGLTAGVVEKTLEQMAGKRTPSRVNIIAGPCIGPHAFRTGPEVAELFSSKKILSDGYFLLDLVEEARIRIKTNFSIPVDFKSDLFSGCTFFENEKYFSHRKGDAGRNLSIIMLKSLSQKDNINAELK